MFVEANNKFNIQFIIETHSEYIIRKFQTLVANNKISGENVKIFYVRHPKDVNQDKKQISSINIQQDGSIDYQIFDGGFFDENDNLELSLLNIQRDRFLHDFEELKKNKEEKYCYYGSAYRLDKDGDLKVFDQIGCEIINSNNNKSENILINSILEPLKKIKNLEVILGDVGLFKILIESLELPARWKLRLVKNFSRREYFEDMLKRLETNYDLDRQAIKLDTKRLKDLEKLDQSSLIGGRAIYEIIKRFNKKIKDPRDDYKGKRNVKIIRDFLKFLFEAFPNS